MNEVRALDVGRFGCVMPISLADSLSVRPLVEQFSDRDDLSNLGPERFGAKLGQDLTMTSKG